MVKVIIGITGCIASGKTTAGRYLKELFGEGSLIDVDEVAKSIYCTDEKVLDEIRNCFSSNVFCVDGTIDYRALGLKVFSSKKDLEKLNELMFGRINKRIQLILAANKDKKYIIIDAAILFDAKLDGFCDINILVRTPDDKRKKFLKAKCDLSDEEINSRLKGQHLNINFSGIDFIIDNTGSIKSFYKKIEQVAGKIKQVQTEVKD